MGCDGGTVPKKRKLIVKKKKLGKFTQPKTITSSIYWEMCRYSKEPLQKPICSDRYGYLYNKKSILLALYDKVFKKNESLKKNFGHIQSLKDITDVNFTPNKSSKEERKYICQITGKDVRGPFHFILFVPCGHVVSKQGYEKIVKKTGKCCCCNSVIERTIIMNNDEEEIEKMKKIYEEEEKVRIKTKKKKKKIKKKKKKSDLKIGKKRKREIKDDEKNDFEQPDQKKVKIDVPEHIKDQMFVNQDQEKQKFSDDTSSFMNRSFL